MGSGVEHGQTGPSCNVDGCGGATVGLGYCDKHYQRLKKWGDPLGHEAQPINWQLIRSGTSKGYVRGWLIGQGCYALQHRYVMEQAIGRQLEPHELVHHKNGKRSDNRLSNLELCVKLQPPTQRVGDLVAWAHEIIAKYEPVVLQLRFV